jgi:hypothetical protein
MEDYNPWADSPPLKEDDESRFRREFVGTPEQIAGFNVYSYGCIDFLSAMHDARDFLANDERAYLKIAAAHARFVQAGWEGDGLIQIGWIPAFLMEGEFGECFWHVKQENNGLSWIACDSELDGLEPLKLELAKSRKGGA